MIVFVTAISWLLIGFTLDLLGVFDGDGSDDGSSDARAEVATVVGQSSLLTTAFGDADVDGQNDGINEDQVSLIETEYSGDDWDGEDMLTRTDDQLTDAELGAQILNEEIGEDFLEVMHMAEAEDAGAQEHGPEITASEPDPEISDADLLAESLLIDAAHPVEITDYDNDEDRIVFAYDPVLTPEPSMELQDGDNPGDKVLLMNGAPMIAISNAASLGLADIVMMETSIRV